VEEARKAENEGEESSVVQYLVASGATASYTAPKLALCGNSFMVLAERSSPRPQLKHKQTSKHYHIIYETINVTKLSKRDIIVFKHDQIIEDHHIPDQAFQA
jgi:hypothetical protein